MMPSHASRLASVVLSRCSASGQREWVTRAWQRVRGDPVTVGTCSRPSTLLGRLGRDRSGASAVVIAVSMTGLLGLAGLGTEVAMWYVGKRTMQAATDSAACSAAMAKYNGQSQTQFTREARSVAGTYNFVDD